MAISGDLKSLNLTELFQTLAGAGQQGTLTVTDGPRAKNFIFTARGITLETSEDQLTANLGDILVARGRLTVAQLRQAEAAVQTKGNTLEEALLELELVERTAVDQALRTQVEEEMYEVFSWDEARFEFQPGKAGTEADRPRPKTRMLFNVRGLLMEAARRLDEWKMIHDVIPGLAAIVVPNGPLATGDYEGTAATIVGLVDGHRTVAQITADGHLARFDTCKFLKELVDAGKARLLDAKELAARGEAEVDAGRPEQGVALLRLALRLHPALHGHRLKLAETLEALGRPAEAAADYRRLARVKLMQNDPKQAAAIQQVAVELAPDDPAAGAELFDMVVDHAEQLDISSTALAEQQLPYVRSLQSHGRTHDAEQALDRLVAKAPDQAKCWRLKVNLRLEANDPAGAVEAYHRILPLLEAGGDRRGVEEVLHSILKLAPNDDRARAQLEALAQGAEVKASAIGPVDPAAKPSRSMPSLMVVVTVIVILSVSLGLVLREYYAGSEVSAARRKATTLQQAGDLHGAAAALREAAEAWPFTLAASGLEAEAKALDLKAESGR